MPIIPNLIADQFGSHVGKYSERLKVTKQKEVLTQAPLLHLECVTIANSGVSISAEAIRACVEHGIPVHFLSGSGTPYAHTVEDMIGGEYEHHDYADYPVSYTHLTLPTSDLV